MHDTQPPEWTEADERRPGESSADYARRIHPELFDDNGDLLKSRSGETVVNINNGGTVGIQCDTITGGTFIV